ncbi:MAG: hypothetical protein V1770_06435 [bacterium]
MAIFSEKIPLWIMACGENEVWSQKSRFCGKNDVQIKLNKYKKTPHF